LIAKKKDCWGMSWQAQVAQIPDLLLKDILRLSKVKAEKKVFNYLCKRENGEIRKLAISQTLKALENVWKTVEKDFFKIISKMTKKPIYINRFDCFLTTGFMCPYSERDNWFMVSLWRNIPHSITTICHEIFHLQFLYYYRDYLKKKGLKDSQIEDLKEALTFLLNEPEFKKIIMVEDRGYPTHEKLRKSLKKIWDKENDFEKFLEKSFRFL